MTEDEVIQKILSSFPELEEDFEDETGLFYNQIFAFHYLAQSAIDSQDREKFLQICELIGCFLLNSSGDVKNALHVSFLEHLNFESSKRTDRSWAFEVMPQIMQQAYRDIMSYTKKLLS